MSNEEILKKHLSKSQYQHPLIGNEWNLAYAAMDEAIKDAVIEKDNRIKELEDGLRELYKWSKPNASGKWNYERAIEIAEQLLNKQP